MPEERIKQDNSYGTLFLKYSGIACLVGGIIVMRPEPSIAGGSLLIAGYLKEGLGYMKGYFNEVLELQEKPIKESRLEKHSR